MDRTDRRAAARLPAQAPEDGARRDQDRQPDLAEDGDEAGFVADEREEASPLAGRDARRESVGEQADFRERFDEDLYNDREDRPAQGNTADVAMGEHRFGSEADAYAEYAWRRPGDHHRGDESAVGQSRDPADSRDDETSR